MKSLFNHMLIGLVCAIGVTSLDAQNTSVTYQGRVRSGSSDFNGAGQFKFALVTGVDANAQATATAVPSGGFVTIINVTSGGSGYVTVPAVTIFGGGGSGATATASVSAGAVTSVTVNNPGSGYGSQPTVSIAAPPQNVSYTTYWSNDGTSSAGSEPAAAVSVPVSNGLFTVRLGDAALVNMTALGAGLFTQPNLQLRIWFNDGVNGFAVLNPAQRLTAAPYALVAVSASNLLGTVSTANLGGTYGNAMTLSNAANSFSGNAAGLTGLNASQLASGTVLDARIGANVARTNQVWLLGGNAGTTPGIHFLGTTDNQPLELKVNNQRGLRLEPTVNDISHSNIVNVVGGSSANFVGAGVYGATIGGGGALKYFNSASTNRVDSDFGTISGGMQNTIQTAAAAATISGGGSNTIQTSATAATISGGGLNVIQNGAIAATIGGGWQNRIQPAIYTTIGGGYGNTIQTSADYATLGGGRENTIQNSAFATIGGGYQNTIQPNASYGTIAGGGFNTIQTNAQSATIGGGIQNLIQTFAFFPTISGGSVNTIQAGAQYATISGGYGNTIQTNASYATISGGGFNSIQTNAYYPTIGGGNGNTIQSNTYYATIPGGRENSAASSAFAAGTRARANHTGAFVWADSQYADFASTSDNQFCIRASGGMHLSGNTPVFLGSTLSQKLNLYGTAFGIGIQNSVQYSRVGVGSGFGWYAGGVHNDGTFDAGGGVTLMTLTAGGLAVNGLFVHASDRNLKENFAPVQPREMLAKVLALPLSSWNLKADPATRHVGPMAQDFYAAFNLGADDKHIATVDADGVALAAIQGLNQKLTEELKRRDAENEELKQRLEKLERLMIRKNGGAP